MAITKAQVETAALVLGIDIEVDHTIESIMIDAGKVEIVRTNWPETLKTVETHYYLAGEPEPFVQVVSP